MALARLLLESPPGRAMQWDALASSPTLQTLQTLPLPRPLASVRFKPPACQAGLTSAGLVAAGSDGCLLGRIHFPCGYVVCLWCMCFCVAEVFFPVLTLYSPRSIVWGLFFFASLSSCYAVFFFNSTCISLLIILCMIVYVTNNKEPWVAASAALLVWRVSELRSNTATWRSTKYWRWSIYVWC